MNLFSNVEYKDNRHGQFFKVNNYELLTENTPKTNNQINHDHILTTTPSDK